MRYQNTVFALAAVATFSFTQCGKPSVPEADRIKHDVEFLASDSLEGRETGTRGEQLAGDYIISRFQEIGLQPSGDSGTFRQTFSFTPHPPIQKHEQGDSVTLGMAVVKPIEGHNIIGLLNKNKDSYIVIGAHYDHLGFGDENSLWAGEKQIHNGADDNASGVAALMALANRLKNRELNHNVLFIAFSGEEKGLWGSNFYCEHPLVPLEKVNYMLNMDMVGHLKEDKTLAVYGTGTTPVWPAALENANKDSLKYVFSESGVGPSDHTSFYLEDLPVLHFFTGQHEHYHKPTDDIEFINFNGITMVVDLLERLIVEVDDDGKLPFVKTQDQDNESSPNFKVTLGVIPDYLYDGEGMRIDGVSEDRPAHSAGLIKGDIVLQMGEHKVTDMMTYMEGLSIFSPGDSTLVTVKRGQDSLTFTVHWD